MATRTDEYTQKLISKSGVVPTVSRQSPTKSELIEEKRTEQKRTEEKKKKNTHARFKPPTLEEVQARCQEKKYGVNPESFWNFYQSKNWMVGKSKMKCWKSALAGWNTRDHNKQTYTRSAYAEGAI